MAGPDLPTSLLIHSTWVLHPCTENRIPVDLVPPLPAGDGSPACIAASERRAPRGVVRAGAGRLLDADDSGELDESEMRKGMAMLIRRRDPHGGRELGRALHAEL
eukprot:COSAG02_NODE_23_length_52893_cov_58.101868_6_plen_105_part_00